MPYTQLDATFHGHRKIHRVAKDLGIPDAYAAGLLANIWSWAIGHAVDGDLSKLYADEIAKIAMWDGDENLLIESLIKHELLTQCFQIHDWMDYVGQYIKARDRKKKYRKKQAETPKINNLDGKGDVPETSRVTVLGHTQGRSRAVLEEKRGEERKGEEKIKGFTNVKPLCRSQNEQHTEGVLHKTSDKKKSGVDVLRGKYAKDVCSVYEHWRGYHPRSAPKLIAESQEYRLIADRLREGSSVSTLCEAIDGCHKTPHNLGINDRGKKYLGLHVIFKSASQVERFVQNNNDPRIGAVINEKELRSNQAGENFVDWAKSLPEGI